MHFNVPQFIELEDKIIGPLTLKQFLFLAGGGGLLVFLWFFVSFGIFIIIAIPVGLFCAACAFYKINGRPFVSLIGSILNYFSKPKLYLWRKNK